MKQLILAILFLFCVISNLKAQDTTEAGKLIPYKEWLAKIEEQNKRIVCIIGYFPKPDEKLNAVIKVEDKTLQNSENVTAIEIQTESKDLLYLDDGKTGTAMMRYFVRITSKDRKFDSISEEILTIDEIPTDVMLKSLPKTFPVYYRRTFKLPKGKYTFDFLADNRGSGRLKKKIKFEVR